MAIIDFFQGGGEIELKNRFISVRLVREALEKRFKIRVLEETPSGMRCKVTRLIRLYGAPVLLPHPFLEVSFHNRQDKSTLTYNITSYDYYLLAAVFLLTFVLELGDGNFYSIDGDGLFLSTTFVFFFALVFMDVKFFAYRIRKALTQLLQ